MKVWLALHEERYPFAAFFTQEEAIAWVSERDEDDYTFDIHSLEVSKNESNATTDSSTS